MPRKSSANWCDREAAHREREDRKRVTSGWVKCAICDRTRMPVKQYREQERVCRECKERHKNAPEGVCLDINRMVGHLENKNAKPQ